jgi:hypothetical protein
MLIGVAVNPRLDLGRDVAETGADSDAVRLSVAAERAPRETAGRLVAKGRDGAGDEPAEELHDRVEPVALGGVAGLVARIPAWSHAHIHARSAASRQRVIPSRSYG